MKYTVRVTKRALLDLEEIRGYIAQDVPDHALLYAAELRDRIESLSHMPRRCPVAPDRATRGREVRHLIHDAYRILFVIEEEGVLVLRIIHGARARIALGSA